MTTQLTASSTRAHSSRGGVMLARKLPTAPTTIALGGVVLSDPVAANGHFLSGYSLHLRDKDILVTKHSSL